MDKDQSKTTQEAAGHRPKKPYTKMAYCRESVFETHALVCGKISATSGPCKSNRKLS